MGTRGYRIWDPILDDVYENKHLKVDETKVYKDAVDTYLGDSPLDISNGSEPHSFNLNESSDDSDDDSSLPASVEAPIIPPAAPLTTQAPSGVTTRKKPKQPVPIPPFKSRTKEERALCQANLDGYASRFSASQAQLPVSGMCISIRQVSKLNCVADLKYAVIAKMS
uniref:Uncharacterized protein n=1 Tax=Strigamia maritima TaxID=126957 RepID=T1J111_STRMM